MKVLEFGKVCLDFKKNTKSSSIYYFTMIFLSEYINDYPEDFKKMTEILEEWGTHDDWNIREAAIYPIIASLKKEPKQILPLLSNWINHKNENIRRLVAESLRPKAEVKRLRNPEKNDKVLVLLSELRMDPSLYVRRAVGNNIKDLSKYMPEKMLDLMESWLENSTIQVRERLATEEGLMTE